MIKKAAHIAFLFIICFHSFSQNKTDSLAVDFHLEFDRLPLDAGKKYISGAKDTLSIETFRCYISNIEIRYKDNSVFKQKNSYHLLDFGKPGSFKIPVTKINKKTIAKITFNIGIDSITNTSGALGDDLDPAKGMYWAWQSGYINTKIEGKSSSCKTRKNEFWFHIGGYLQPYYALRKMEFPIDKADDKNIHIGIDLSPFFSNIDLWKTNSIMIPGKEAMQLADYSTKMFYLK